MKIEGNGINTEKDSKTQTDVILVNHEYRVISLNVYLRVGEDMQLINFSDMQLINFNELQLAEMDAVLSISFVCLHIAKPFDHSIAVQTGQ